MKELHWIVGTLSLCAVLNTVSTYLEQDTYEQSYSYHDDGDAEGGQGQFGNYQYDVDTTAYSDPPPSPYRRPRGRTYGGRQPRRYRNRYLSSRGEQYVGYGGQHEEDDYDAGSDGYRESSVEDYRDYEVPPRQEYARSGRQSPYGMNRYGRSGTFGNLPHRKRNYVPVIIKQKKKKKRKIISTSSGFYIPGGTAVFGKFRDLHSCEKACELTATCFAGDFNPWLGKCYLHSNITACQNQRAHKQITHFKKVPCDVVETPRGLITLGTAIYGGLEQKSAKSLMECIKDCSRAGGGIAATPALAATTPQICFGIDYNFASHRCYFHVDIAVCGGNADTNSPPVTPVQLVANPATVNILLCPIGTG